MVKVAETIPSLKLPEVSLVLARYVNTPKVSIGLDFLDTPAATVTKPEPAAKFSSVFATSLPGSLLIITSFKSKSTKLPSACLGYSQNNVIWLLVCPAPKFKMF